MTTETSLMKKLIEKEIKWCKEHSGMESYEFERGFIAGLEQAVLLMGGKSVCHVCGGAGVVERDGKLQTCVWC